MVTPFSKNEDLDIEALKSNIDFYVKNEVHGLVVGGSTGEFATLSPDEHKQIINAAVDQVKGRVPLLAGTAYCSTRNTIAMSKYAEDAGVEGLLIVPPFYSKPKDNEIYEHYSAIGSAVNIPIMVYNNPFTSKVDMKPELIEKLSHIKNVTHVKESSCDISRIWKLRELTKDRLTIFCGADNLALESFVMGAKGWICVAANILPRECAELFDLAVVERDYEQARKLYTKLLPLSNLLEDTGMFSALSKAGLDILGQVGGRPRMPTQPPGPKELDELKAILKSFGKTS
jgi:4-hydroxy-tetrahydrodipicolinate synthase